MSKDKLWGGRFAQPTNKFVEEFTASIDFDKRLYGQDIRGSIAHASMLGKQGIIPMADLEAFYQGMLPHLEAALLYLDEFEFGKLPPAQLRLHWLTLATAEAALSVEIYRSPTLPMAPDVSRFIINHTNTDN